MPNSENSDNHKLESRFYGFVMTYYRNDPYLMLDKFAAKIAEVAALVSIDWYETRGSITLDGTFAKGRSVVGLEKADSGRVSVAGFSNSHTWTHEGETYTVRFPTLRFKNFRKHFPEPEIFDGYKALKEEYDSYISGYRVSRVSPDSERQNKYIAAAQKRKEEDKLAKADALAKDAKWLNMLGRLQQPCPYFKRKGIPELFEWVSLYQGATTLGQVAGDFTALKILDLSNLSFRGMQRIYPKQNQKLFRRGIDPSGAAFPVPERQPVNGESIYVVEAPADAGMSYKLTGSYSVAAMFADNIASIVQQLRRLCPDSEIIMVADNDQYGNGPNKGVDVCEGVLRNTPGKTFMLIPNFDEEGRRLLLKDLTDFVGLYGHDAGLRLLRSYKS